MPHEDIVKNVFHLQIGADRVAAELEWVVLPAPKEKAVSKRREWG